MRASPEAIGKARTLAARYKLPRQHVLEAFGLVRFPAGSSYAIKNLMRLLDERGDLYRVHELVEIYGMCFPSSRSLTPTGFYSFYKKNWFTKEDVSAFRIYGQVLADFTNEPVSVWPFMSAGGLLIEKLHAWATDEAANTTEELMALFCYLVFPKVQSWKSYLLVQPKAVLDSYGWHLFLEAIEKGYGDKWRVLRVSDKAQLRIQEEGARLMFLHQIRQGLFEAGDLQGYDTLGKEISRDGEKAVFARYNLTYKNGVCQ